MNRRYDKKRRLLKSGESERGDGYYQYRWTDRKGSRHTITASTLEELRKKEEDVLKDKFDGIRTEAKDYTLDDMFELWCRLKRGLKDNTYRNYCYMYTQFVKPDIGHYRIQTIKRSDVKAFYNTLFDERNLKISSIDNVHTVLHQVFQVAADDGYIRTNITDNLLKELKQAHNVGKSHRKALTVAEQELFLEYLRRENNKYHHWYTIFAVMMGTGLRVGELCGLRWEDIDLDEGIINVNHTLVYYNHETNGCYFNIHTPKTKAGERVVPMLDYVKEAFLLEKEYQEINGRECKATIDGYTDFIFINRFGNVQNQSTLNKSIRRIIRDCNDEQLLKGKNSVLLPRFSCHSMRHTFTTRLVEANVNLKVIQDTLGHSDFSTTMDVYTDVTKELKQREFDGLQDKMRSDKK